MVLVLSDNPIIRLSLNFILLHPNRLVSRRSIIVSSTSEGDSLKVRASLAIREILPLIAKANLGIPIKELSSQLISVDGIVIPILKEFDIYNEDGEEITLLNRKVVIKSQLYGEIQLTNQNFCIDDNYFMSNNQLLCLRHHFSITRLI